MSKETQAAFTRRGFLGIAGSTATMAALAACAPGGGGGGGGGGGAGRIEFWNMPWGGTAFNPLDEEITLAYEPADGLPDVSYQAIQWQNWLQTFATATASNTGPAVSSGGGTLAFLFEEQGKIAYADDLIDSWKKSGLYDDFLPGLIDTMKTANGYAAVPYNVDLRPLWYNTALLEEAGATAPTDWQSYIDACEALKKIDVYGFGISGAGLGFQVLSAILINNGGGFFDEEQKPNCVTPANIEALEFVVELVEKGYMDPGAVAYTTANSDDQWKAKKFGMGWDATVLSVTTGNADIVVGDPIVAASGDTGTVLFPNNIMMYKDTPSQEGSEAFLSYYFENMAPLWTENTGIGLPVLKSIAETPEFQENANAVKMLDAWLPVSKTWGAPGSNTVFVNQTLIDGPPAVVEFTQSLLSLDVAPEEALKTLQDELVSNL